MTTSQNTETRAWFGIIGNKPKTPETSSCAAYLSTAPGNSVFPEAAASTRTARRALAALEGATKPREMRLAVRLPSHA
ncbi:hypothetical protein E2C01_009965 [Portunus trituberculatus]|uniref:Uncharacterized protein n=1 Tax=Portunus trituberculatus TaxID=210409 RepID=A0A5B7D7E8_PORTR|nr:hypothetical protein [Portunus trituberculatus]